MIYGGYDGSRVFDDLWACNGTAWSQDPHTYRSVFLVGDAPPHLDYEDDVQYTATVREFHAAELTIETRPRQRISIDGEVLARTPVVARVAECAIEVVVPA